jgi:hypothetical protein
LIVNLWDSAEQQAQALESCAEDYAALTADLGRLDRVPNPAWRLSGAG